MTSAVWAETDVSRFQPRAASIAACLAYLVVILARLTIQYAHDGGLFIEDDAYYYEVIARNIARTGLSTFDGQTLTNGYHPLWLGLLVLKELAFGTSSVATIAIELLLTVGGLWNLLTSFRSNSVSIRITFALIFSLVAWPMIAKGMEVSLLVFALGLFVRTSIEVAEGGAGPLRLGAAAVLCIGARIDAAVFVLPILVLVLARPRRIAPALVLIGSAGVVYAAVNLWLFGVPLPISGEIKSLGGLQLNAALIDQVAAFWAGHDPIPATARFLNSFIGRTLLFSVLPCLALPFVARDAKSWSMTIGFVIGALLFFTKLVFFSSWAVWPWYAFPAILGLVVLSHIADDRLTRAAAPRLRPLEIAALSLAGLAVLGQLGLAPQKDDKGFAVVNTEAVAQLGAVLSGARVAMGDRAGSFAFLYPGPLTQLEGLVNDKEYFEAIKSHRNIMPLLCRRGVRFVLSYQRDLGRYDTVDVHVLRRQLTHFPGPTLTLSHVDEVGRVADLAAYNNADADEGDNYLYAWRLSGCDAIPAGPRQ